MSTDDRIAMRDKARAARRLADDMEDAMAAKNLVRYAESLEARLC